MSEITALIEKIKERFKEKAGDLLSLDGKQFEFQLTGDGGGTYTFAVNGKELNVSQGAASNPSLTVTVSKNDLIALTTGKLGAMQAFMTGKIKVKGDMGLAMKLQSLLS